MQLNLTCKAACVGIALALMSPGCAMFEPKGEPNIAQPVGSTWTRVTKNTGSYGSGTVEITATRAKERMWQGRRVVPMDQSNGLTLLQAPDSSWIAFVKGDVPVMSFDPPAGYEWPLTVGKTWTRKFNMTIHASKRTFPVEQNVKVEAYEDVATPAGTFKAFRVRSVDNAGNDNTNWFSSDLGVFVKQRLVRTPKHAAGPGMQEIELVSQTIRK